MTVTQQIITVSMCALATIITRFLPFIIFNEKREAPKFIKYMGKVLPAAVFGMLIVYCLKDVEIVGGSHGIPELIGIAVTVGLHLWKHKLLLSIFVGTAVYMVLVNLVF